ncbi:pre-coat protein [Dolichos yellow mosaic virus]|uniref:Protein V2 n=1 Tax=Dolichos yellow mosaic virus TaxID=333968 RepID=Q6WRV6_9GEMI|nr:pre-coat protein [Dolichos yellow mosaic virus]AAQ16290.1 pre-coat protein [Dolichos yellow mosaic virus]
MWDPLVNDFPDTLHGLRCMLAVKFVQELLETYPRDSNGHILLEELIQVLRCKRYAKAQFRYGVFYSKTQRTSKAQLRHSICNTDVSSSNSEHQSS